MTYTEKVILSAKKRLSDIRGKIVVGFSGGADSTVLLEVMRAVFDEENITAVHINHMLRGKEADADEEFCRSFADLFQMLRCEAETVQVDMLCKIQAI